MMVRGPERAPYATDVQKVTMFDKVSIKRY
jgi:hypothetical protein